MEGGEIVRSRIAGVNGWSTMNRGVGGGWAEKGDSGRVWQWQATRVRPLTCSDAFTYKAPAPAPAPATKVRVISTTKLDILNTKMVRKGRVRFLGSVYPDACALYCYTCTKDQCLPGVRATPPLSGFRRVHRSSQHDESPGISIACN